MFVFGEEFPTDNLTPEERAEVTEWYNENKTADVPADPDRRNGQYPSEVSHGVMNRPSSELDIALALEALKGNPDWVPDVEGPENYVELYRLVHPLGGNMSVEDVAEAKGLNKVTVYRRLKRLFVLNPQTYTLHKWPTKGQLDLFRLIHPDLGGLTLKEAAKALGMTAQHANQMLMRLRKNHPEAMAFERVKHTAKIQLLKDENEGTEVKEKF